MKPPALFRALSDIADRSKPVAPIAEALLAEDVARTRVGASCPMVEQLLKLLHDQRVILLPAYTPVRAGVAHPDQLTLSKSNRKGPIIGLVSSPKNFSFGIRVKDHNVFTAGEDEHLGAYRTFLLLGPDGRPTRVASSPLRYVATASGAWPKIEDIICPGFVGPASAFGSLDYFVRKVLLLRLKEEIRYLDGEIARLRDLGCRLRADPLPPSVRVLPVEREPSVPFSFPTLSAEVWPEGGCPGFQGTYPRFAADEASYARAWRAWRLRKSRLYPQLHFLVRAMEYAFFLREGHRALRLPTPEERGDYEATIRPVPPKRILWSSWQLKILPEWKLFFRVHRRTERVKPGALLP